MARTHVRSLLVALTVFASAACGAGPPDATATPAATTWQDFTVAYCNAWDALFRAVGNPDTASGSDVSQALDEAVAAGDGPAADRVAAEMIRELKVGREQVAVAAGYERRAAMMAEFDRLFVAFEAHTEAKRTAASGESGATEPQSAFEQARGPEAWVAMFEAGRAVERTAAEPEHHCANVPVGV